MYIKWFSLTLVDLYSNHDAVKHIHRESYYRSLLLTLLTPAHSRTLPLVLMHEY